MIFTANLCLNQKCCVEIRGSIMRSRTLRAPMPETAADTLCILFGENGLAFPGPGLGKVEGRTPQERALPHKEERASGGRESGRPSCPCGTGRSQASSVPTEAARPGLWGHHWSHREGTDARVALSRIPHWPSHVSTLNLVSFAPTPSMLTKHKALYVRPCHTSALFWGP